MPWWAAGLLLGLVQVLAIALVKPMGVSKQFVVADTKVLNRVAPEYSENTQSESSNAQSTGNSTLLLTPASSYEPTPQQ